MIRRIVLQEDESFSESMLNRAGAFDEKALSSATYIVNAVREQGDDAIFEFTRKFDDIDLDDLRVPQEAIDAAADNVPQEFMDAIVFAASNIRDFHERQVTQSWFNAKSDGQVVGVRITPLERVGVYVPGGRAQYPSTVLMDVIPAKVAGVSEVIMCAPPTKDGEISPYTLAAAKVAGVDAVYRVGGAQAIAAMAYGTQTIPRVDKVVGPGNAYVAAAKKVVSGDVGIDMIAGPSEVCVLADDTSDPEYVAIDLMAQAEHDPMATCYLVTTDETLVDAVEACISEFISQSTREEITRQSLENRGLVVVCPCLAAAVDAVNVIAPEHLEINMTDPMELLGSIKNAGAIFLGQWTPESVGDYVAGPDHTLPTGGTARFSSPLSVEDFIKRTSVIQYSLDALFNDADAITTIADAEGLWSHAQAVKVRKRKVLEFIGEEEDADLDDLGEDDDEGDGEMEGVGDVDGVGAEAAEGVGASEPAATEPAAPAPPAASEPAASVGDDA